MHKLSEGECEEDSDAELLAKEAIKWWLAQTYFIELRWL